MSSPGHRFYLHSIRIYYPRRRQ